MTMEIISVLLIVVSGAALSSGFGRLVLGWRYDVVAVATSFVIFGVGGLAIIVFSKLGGNGIALTLVTAILLTFVFVKFNAKDAAIENDRRNLLGYSYWMALLIIFTISGLKSWGISACINQMYSLGENVNSFYFTLCLFVAVGCLSMLMFIRELKRAER